jgi:hypothetical protein
MGSNPECSIAVLRVVKFGFGTLLSYLMCKEDEAAWLLKLTNHGGSHTFWTIGSQMAVSVTLTYRQLFTLSKIPGTHSPGPQCGWNQE